jgi:hypothetical protein
VTPDPLVAALAALVRSAVARNPKPPREATASSQKGNSPGGQVNTEGNPRRSIASARARRNPALRP